MIRATQPSSLRISRTTIWVTLSQYQDQKKTLQLRRCFPSALLRIGCNQVQDTLDEPLGGDKPIDIKSLISYHSARMHDNLYCSVSPRKN